MKNPSTVASALFSKKTVVKAAAEERSPVSRVLHHSYEKRGKMHRKKQSVISNVFE